MSNMSYCRFRNTLSDLQDCYDNMENVLSDPDEIKARKRLIEMCHNIWYDYGEYENEM